MGLETRLGFKVRVKGTRVAGADYSEVSVFAPLDPLKRVIPLDTRLA